MRPTEEQIEEFWERCGISQSRGTGYWYYPDSCARGTGPGLDLNNLFRWAVPKIADLNYYIELYHDKPIFVATAWKHDGMVATVVRDKDPALALFWAIYKVIDGNNTPAEH